MVLLKYRVILLNLLVWEFQIFRRILLVLLVSKYDSANKLLPADLEVQAHVTEWLFFVTKEMWDGPAVA
jgi:hypothetical protein